MICVCLPTYKAVLIRLFPNLKCAKSYNRRHHLHLSPVPTPTFPPEDLKHIAALNTSSRTNTFDLEYCEVSSVQGLANTGVGGRGEGSVFGTSKTSLCIQHHHNRLDGGMTMPASTEEVREMARVARRRESRPLSITQEFIREIGLVVDERRLVVEEMEGWGSGDVMSLGMPRSSRRVDR